MSRARGRPVATRSGARRAPRETPVDALARSLARARSSRRLSVFLCCYLIFVGAVAWRLVGVQVVAAEEYRGLAERQLQREIELPARRGKVYDRGGEPLALSLAAATIYANPHVLRDNDLDVAGVAAELAPLLDRPADSIAERLEQDSSFVYLARQLPRRVGKQVDDLELPGVGVLEEATRTYPAGSLAAQVVGFAGVDNAGLSGLEAQYDKLLAGSPGQLRLERAPGGLTISAAPREVESPSPGADLVLTLDRQIQYTAERLLTEAVEEHDARGGSAVVLDVGTGEVLAMASVPTFHPEDTGAAEGYHRKNRAVTDVFEPGSVNKVVTAAAALEEGLVTPEEPFEVPDRYQVGSKRFRDAQRHPTWNLSFAEIIERSSNVGTIMVAERIGPDRMHEYLRRFGYAQPTGLDFPGESGGLLPDVEGWWDTSLPTISIGQGVSATLLQVAGVFQTIASDGERIDPTLVRGTVGADGRLRATSAGEREQVVSEETAGAIADMLVGVVESEDGTGARAAVPGYRVGGKTGTAQKPSETSRGYEPGAYIATFAGFAPAEDPELVAAVMLDEPTPIYGGVTAAPVFSELLRFSLGHRRVPPSTARDVVGRPEVADADEGSDH